MNITDLVVALKPRKSDQLVILAAPKLSLPSLKSGIRTKMRKAYKEYQAEGSVDDLHIELKSSLDDAYAEAYMVGKGSSQISKRELKWVNKVKREQFAYLDGFMSDLEGGGSVMPPRDRMDAYLSRLDGMYWSGYVAGSGDDVEIDWVLGVGNNCDDCMEFADGGPYGKNELEAVPGDGSTDCLFNCGCHLERTTKEG